MRRGSAIARQSVFDLQPPHARSWPSRNLYLPCCRSRPRLRSIAYLTVLKPTTLAVIFGALMQNLLGDLFACFLVDTGGAWAAMNAATPVAEQS